jgi:hypothetical protein
MSITLSVDPQTRVATLTLSSGKTISRRVPEDVDLDAAVRQFTEGLNSLYGGKNVLAVSANFPS